MVNTEIRLIIFFVTRWRSSILLTPSSQQKQDLKLTVAQIISSLLKNSGWNWRKLGKPTFWFRYDLNQISYDYTVEVTNELKGLDLVDRVPEELWAEVCNIVQEAFIKTIPRKRIQKGKMVVWGGLKNCCEEKGSKKQRGKGKIYPFECRVPKNSKER